MRAATFVLLAGCSQILGISDNFHGNAGDGDGGTSTDGGLVVSAANSTLTATPANASADGVATSTLTLTLEDASGTPIGGAAVTFASSRGDTIVPATGSTDSTGHFTAVIGPSTTSGPRNVMATAAGLTLTTSMTFVPAPCSGTVQFTNETAVASTNPATVMAADLNGDGVLDLAIATGAGGFTKGPVNVKLGSAFTTGNTVNDDESPEEIAAGDFDGDGDADLAIANSGGSGVSIYLNNGAGVFTLKGDVTTGAGAYSVVVGDFNHDTKLDLAVANVTANTVSVVLGNGDGTFGTAANYPATMPFKVATGDFNGDGDLDLVVAAAGTNTAIVLIGKGDGTFTQHQTLSTGATGSGGTGLQFVATADLNGDGYLDLAFANGSNNDVGIALNKGEGTFVPAITYPAGSDLGASAVAIGDFNTDGVPDLAVANIGTTRITVLRGLGNGTFTTLQSIPVPSVSYYVITADFNNDGRPDIATANLDLNTATVLLNTGCGP